MRYSFENLDVRPKAIKIPGGSVTLAPGEKKPIEVGGELSEADIARYAACKVTVAKAAGRPKKEAEDAT